MKPITLSAFLVVRNEEKNLDRCLKSLDFCDEIIIVDQESTDKTLKIAKKYTNKIYHDKCWGYADPSRVLGEGKCKGKWIFNIDADEEVQDKLKEEILSIIKNPTHDAYRIHRDFYYLGKFMRYTGQDDWVLRLHKKGAIKYVPDIHVCAVPNKGIKIGRLHYSLNHFAFNSMEQVMERTHRYAKIQAQTDKKYHKFPRNPFGILYLPLFNFIYQYIIKRGFLDGRKGFKYACVNFYYHVLIYRYLWFK